jgi:hypothetical protein
MGNYFTTMKKDATSSNEPTTAFPTATAPPTAPVTPLIPPKTSPEAPKTATQEEWSDDESVDLMEIDEPEEKTPKRKLEQMFTSKETKLLSPITSMSTHQKRQLAFKTVSMFDKNPDFASWSVKEVGIWLRGLLKTTFPDFDAEFILEKLKEDLVNGQSLLTFTAKDFEKNKIPSGVRDRIKKELKTLGLTSTTETVKYHSKIHLETDTAIEDIQDFEEFLQIKGISKFGVDWKNTFVTALQVTGTDQSDVIASKLVDMEPMTWMKAKKFILELVYKHYNDSMWEELFKVKVKPTAKRNCFGKWIPYIFKVQKSLKECTSRIKDERNVIKILLGNLPNNLRNEIEFNATQNQLENLEDFTTLILSKYKFTLDSLMLNPNLNSNVEEPKKRIHDSKRIEKPAKRTFTSHYTEKEEKDETPLRYCTYCEKDVNHQDDHQDATCWTLHPEMRPVSNDSRMNADAFLKKMERKERKHHGKERYNHKKQQ